MERDTSPNPAAHQPEQQIVRRQDPKTAECRHCFIARHAQHQDQHHDHKDKRQPKAQQQSPERHIMRSCHHHSLSLAVCRIIVTTDINEFLLRLCGTAVPCHLTGCTGRSLQNAHRDTSFSDSFHNTCMAYFVVH